MPTKSWHLHKTYTYTRKSAQVVTSLQTSCYKSVHKLSTSCARTACSQLAVTSLKQAVNNLWQAWWHYQPCYKIVLTSLLQPWYNKDVTRLSTQGCNNLVISSMSQTCQNNLATSLIISTKLLQVVNKLFQTCWQLVTSRANTPC
jgi:hypothetical protein